MRGRNCDEGLTSSRNKKSKARTVGGGGAESLLCDSGSGL